MPVDAVERQKIVQSQPSTCVLLISECVPDKHGRTEIELLTIVDSKLLQEGMHETRTCNLSEIYGYPTRRERPSKHATNQATTSGSASTKKRAVVQKTCMLVKEISMLVSTNISSSFF